MGSIDVLAPGLLTSIQDRGRFGFKKFGVPVSGAMDQQSSALANHLLNNDAYAAVMEITLTGPQLVFNSDALIVVTGADLSPSVNGGACPMSRLVQLSAGDILSFGAAKKGVRAYIGVKGGFQTEIVMNSFSFYSGITSQPLIKKGDRLSIHTSRSSDQFKSVVKEDPTLFDSPDLLCSPGPEFVLLKQEDQKNIFGLEFTVSSDNNRMGYRFNGDKLSYPDSYSMLTSSVLPGTVQLTPSGQLIALMRDCQTTGGYPRILQLSETAINRLAQKRTQDRVQFVIRDL